MLKFHRKNIDFYIGNNNNGSYKIASKLLKTFSMDSIDINFDYILINNDAKFLKDVFEIYFFREKILFWPRNDDFPYFFIGENYVLKICK